MPPDKILSNFDEKAWPGDDDRVLFRARPICLGLVRQNGHRATAANLVTTLLASAASLTTIRCGAASAEPEPGGSEVRVHRQKAIAP